MMFAWKYLTTNFLTTVMNETVASVSKEIYFSLKSIYLGVIIQKEKDIMVESWLIHAVIFCNESNRGLDGVLFGRSVSIQNIQIPKENNTAIIMPHMHIYKVKFHKILYICYRHNVMYNTSTYILHIKPWIN